VVNELEGFSINILRADQQALSTNFSGGWQERAPPPFRLIGSDLAPRLEGALASDHCEPWKMLAVGDHTMVFGRILSLPLALTINGGWRLFRRVVAQRNAAKLLRHRRRQTLVVDGERMTVGIEGPLIINDVETCIRSTLRNAGLFCLPRSLVMHYLEQGQMETVLDSHSVEVPGLSLYYPSRS
jgi:DNA-binding transcriptional LysR family regulator